MKSSSWEIILAGLLFTGVAIYLLQYNDQPSKSKETSFSTDSLRTINFDQNLKVIKFEALKDLDNLDNLESLENLENLKNLSSFLPKEVRDEFESEINSAIKGLEKENINVQVDTVNKTISISKALPATVDTDGNWTAVSPGVFAYIKEFDASDLKEADLDLPFGSIEVIGGEDSSTKLTIEATGQISTKEELLSKIKTSSSIENNRAIFKVISASTRSKDENVHLQATLSVPKNFDLRMITAAGHISARSINGTQDLETLGGHIKMKDVTGDITAKTSGGHISVDHSEGSLTLLSLGGHIQTRNATGVISMITSGGNLQALDTKGSVEASTNGGNIELRFIGLNGNSSAKTGAGTISLFVPKSANTHFDLSGNNVEIDPDLNFTGSSSSGKAIGTIGENRSSLKAKTNYGKVTLKAHN